MTKSRQLVRDRNIAANRQALLKFRINVDESQYLLVGDEYVYVPLGVPPADFMHELLLACYRRGLESGAKRKVAEIKAALSLT